MLDENLIKILRQKQAQLIKKSNKSVSFSAVVSQTLRKGLKKLILFLSIGYVVNLGSQHNTPQ